MSTLWDLIVELINDGEAVRSRTPNRPLGQLARRTQHLFDRFNTAAVGEALFLYDVNIEDDALEGDIVYFDEGANEYKRALAAVEFNETGGFFTIAESSFAVGMVFQKTDTDRGHILTMGALRDFDLANTIINGDKTEAGAYYLSTQVPGKITIQKPPVSVYIMFNRGDDTFHFNPTPRDLLESHIHYRFDLVAEPAGDATCVDISNSDVRHDIVNQDSSQPGWLPADDPIFNGAAPAGAKFGYNLSQHLELRRVFPPIPTESVYLEVNGDGIPLNDSINAVAIVDQNGIWWLDDCPGRAPWPLGLDCVEGSSSSSSSSGSSAPCDCLAPFIQYLPGHGDCNLDEMDLRLWFTKMVFKTDASVVTSLEPCDENQPIVVLNCDGEPGKTGKLCLAFDFDKLQEVAGPGFQVVKGFSGSTILVGPAVTSIVPGLSAEITGVGVEGADWAKQGEAYVGDLTIGLEDQTQASREGGIELVALNSVRKEFDDTNQFFFLSMPGGRPSDVRGRVNLPRFNLPSPLKMQLFFWFVSRQGGALPLLDATFRRYTRPEIITDLPTAVDEEFIIGVPGQWDPAVTFSKGGEYKEVATPFFTAAQGETVDFTLGWNGVGLANGFGFMRVGFRVELDS